MNEVSDLYHTYPGTKNSDARRTCFDSDFTYEKIEVGSYRINLHCNSIIYKHLI